MHGILPDEPFLVQNAFRGPKDTTSLRFLPRKSPYPSSIDPEQTWPRVD
jgi:hypothetical protein